MQIFIATGNLHKLSELKAILPAAANSGGPVTYLSTLDFPGFVMPEETAGTLEGNARIKAVAGAARTGLICLSDDTGLFVDALNGAPGVHTARYAGENATARDNNEKLLAALKDLSPEKRTAHFRTVACLAFPNGQTHFFEGVVQGTIAAHYHGVNGFGYDPVFIVSEAGKAFAEMSETQKNKLSHRARAFRKLAEFLVNLKN